MSDYAIRFRGVGKMYKIYASRRDNLVDALGIDRILRSKRDRYREFWALRGIDFDLARGARIGIIGRNGAGKSTLLKLVTQNLPPTEGTVDIRGSVQALLEVGGGLHPEFTGRENVHASLGFLGLGRTEIEAATRDIAAFTELGRFLDQPFKTYSLGMQARLGLGIATTIRPEILIIDEVLGAGDAYFFAKSTARMQELLNSGASVLLVSHALDQISRFCDETMWLDRGRLVMRGPTTEVVKAYEKFVRELDERRLLAKNRKLQGEAFDSFEREGYTDVLHVAITPQAGHSVDVADVALSRDDRPEDAVAVGGAQDADRSQSACVAVDLGGWSDPLQEDGTYFRSVAGTSGLPGRVDFSLWFFYPDSSYSTSVRYRSDAPVTVTVSRGSDVLITRTLAPADDWSVGAVAVESTEVATASPGTSLSRWSGQGALTISGVRLLDEGGREEIVFDIGRPLCVLVDVQANAAGTFPLTPAALVFRADGLVMTRHVGERTVLDVREGDRFQARLKLSPLLLGNGSYLLSLGLYRTLDLEDVEPSEFYDYFDKSFEFQVTGSPPLHNELVRHPGEWTLELPARVRSDHPAQVG
jgi:lipopolysaccharide transport system ATP-binding protein